MLFLLVVCVFMLCLYRINVRLVGFNGNYLTKDSTNSIRGVFILLIFITHSLQYVESSSYGFNSVYDTMLMWFVRNMSQLVVVMFLFYSGYGVSESFKNKGDDYLKSFPRKRLLTTLLNFDVAVIVFILLALLIGTPVTVRQCILSLVGWEAVGNSNWYIFVILICYLFSYVSLRLFTNKSWRRVVLLFAFCLISIVALSMRKGDWWYNTMLSFPMGFLYSTYKDPIERFLKKNYWPSLVSLLLLFVVLHHCLSDRFALLYNAKSIVFAILIVMLTMKVSIDNKPLRWLGEHLFPIYIYMRVPMIIIEHKYPELIATQPTVFIMFSLIITLIITCYYRLWQIKL